MKKRFVINKWSLFVLSSMFFFLFGCNKNEIPFIEETQNISVNFTAVKNDNNTTRASGTSWDNGDKIGVFAIKHQTTLQQNNIVDNNDNLPFTTNGSGFFFPQTKSIYYPTDGTSMDIISYYPYKENIVDYTYPINIAEQTDFFYSNNLKGINKNNTQNNALVFNRVLSKLVLNIASKTSGKSLNGLSVTMSDAKTRAAFSLSTGTLSPDENSVTTISLPISGSDTQKQVSALLLPEGTGNIIKIHFKLGEDSYSWTIPHALESGKVYSYEIKLDITGVTVKVGSYMEIPVYTAADTAPNSVAALHMVGSNSWLNSSSSSTPVRNYSILFDTKNRIPYWVAYPMHPIYLGSADRTDAWEYDPIIPQQYQPTLYSGWNTNGLDRGHLLASADRNASRELNKTTFYFTNMAPQNHGMNGSTWADLETRVRYWCKQTAYDTLYVVTGCILPVPPEQITYTKDNNGQQSAIPKYLYKALLRKNIAKNSYTSIAFKMENKNTGITYINSAVSVADLEKETGFTFFPSLPSEVAATVKQNKSLTPDWN